MADRQAREHDPKITVIQSELFNENRSKGDKYRELFIGRPGLGALIAYEIAMVLTSWVPGAIGLLLRSKFYPMILGSVGRNVVFGVSVTLRHPHTIHNGDNVVIDDLCCLDAKGSDNQGITIGNGVFVGRNTILSCKNGDIVIDDEAMVLEENLPDVPHLQGRDRGILAHLLVSDGGRGDRLAHARSRASDGVGAEIDHGRPFCPSARAGRKWSWKLRTRTANQSGRSWFSMP